MAKFFPSSKSIQDYNLGVCGYSKSFRKTRDISDSKPYLQISETFLVYPKTGPISWVYNLQSDISVINSLYLELFESNGEYDIKVLL